MVDQSLSIPELLQADRTICVRVDILAPNVLVAMLFEHVQTQTLKRSKFSIIRHTHVATVKSR